MAATGWSVGHDLYESGTLLYGSSDGSGEFAVELSGEVALEATGAGIAEPQPTFVPRCQTKIKR